MKNFALIGAAGYIAPRHMKAIKDTGHRLIVALDKNDSVGIIDSYFPESAFFTEFERFDRHAEKLKREGEEHRLHYVSICSPNYLHDSHIRFALRAGADAICEKPLVLNPWNLDAILQMERETGRHVYTILQLRLHPTLIAARQRLADNPSASVDLTYITGRGHWYLYSWKGNQEKSGGIATNIGIHFFDLLIWLFGRPKASRVHLSQPTRAAGFLDLERARVRWFLSIDCADLPESAVRQGRRTFRSLTIDGQELEFSEGFEDLHTRSYQEILNGRGFGAAEAQPSIELAHNIRFAVPTELKGEYHPWIKKIK